jgi:di/tricarboxylate transporter
MTSVLIYLSVVLAAALVLLYTEWLRSDVTAFLVMLALMLPWQPTPQGWKSILSIDRALSGFGSPAVIMVAGMFVLSAAMVHTGGAQLIAKSVLQWGAKSELRFQLTILVVVTLFSAFVNDTTTVIIWMPMVLAACREQGLNSSRILLLLAYASLLGGQWTLIGTRSNILISDYLRSRTGEGLAFFSFTPVAASVLIAALAFFVLIGKKLLPQRAAEDSLTERYDVTEYLTELLTAPKSHLVGRQLAELKLEDRYGVKVLEIIRGEEHLTPSDWLRLAPGDVLVVQGRISKITDLLDRAGLKVQEELVMGEKTLRSVDLRMAEAVVAPNSPYEGQSLEEIDFRHRYGGVSVLAVARHGHPLLGRPAEHLLHVGDSMLLVGHGSEMDRLRGEPGLFLLESRPFPSVGKGKAILSIGLLLLVTVTSAARIFHPGFVIPLAAFLAVLLRCISMRQVYESINLNALIVVGCLIPYGYALEETGTARLIGEGVSDFLEPFGVHLMFAALLLFSILLTQLIENAAVAVILAPIAYELAVAQGADPKAYLLGVAICISAAFMTPVAHESTILVMIPGHYRFGDYLRLGTPLAILVWLATTIFLPLFFPLVRG